MTIVDLTPETESAYLCCLEDYSSDIKEGGAHKADWYREMSRRGLRVKLALNDAGRPAGMIHYVPIEESFAAGRGLHFVLCIWVHARKMGVGDNRKRGLGTALLRAAEEDARALGAKGMAAWGMALPVFMRASWFRKHGYRKADALGMQVLLWKPFAEDAEPPRWVRPLRKPQAEPGKVVVTAVLNGWCPAMAMSYERAKRACAEIGGKAEFRPVHTLDPATFAEWGISDALFVDGKQVRTGPPPSYKKIRGKIARRVKALG